jgi:hemoglobin/transferrin/lactoferrin receptor protein
VPPFGETFPTKPFPDTTFTLIGAFAQSEIELGRFSVIPGVRFDRYTLSPSQAGYTAGTVVELSDQAVTPRIGVVWRLSPAFAPYAQWSSGFRAPTPDQVNNGFTNLASGYRSIGNPNLKAERASSVEVGARGRMESLRWSAAAFDNRYADFISQRIVGGAGTPANPSIFQFINLTDARIRGVELRTDWQPDDRWFVNAAIGYTRGDTQVGSQVAPLDTIQPWRAVLRVRHELGAWSLRAALLHSAGKDPGRVAAANVFVPPAFTVLDLGASWRMTRDLTLIANLNNVLDARFWQWSDVRGLPAATPVRDAFTAPGRNFQVSLRHDF